MKQLVLALSGASGAIYGIELARQLVRHDLHLHMVVSPAAQRVMHDELDIRKASAETLLGGPHERVSFHGHRDIGARIASGSFLTDGMVICPCSSHTVAAIAAGLGDNLITRAAMVTLKERRDLILVPREMPLSTLELEAMTKLSRNGVVICPACPGFYMRPQRVEDLVNFVVGRILDLLKLPHDLHVRWDPGQAGDVERT